jgi:DNA-binding XRE family transcriptional regulator
MTTLREQMEKLPGERRRKVEERANVLIAEEMSLRQLRSAREKTQVQMAEYLGIDQANVSRIEQRTDLLLSTLSSYVEASGGTLRLVAEFPNRPPISLSGIGSLSNEDSSKPS